MFVSRSLLGTALTEGAHADRVVGPPMGLAGCCDAGISIFTEQPEEKALEMGTHVCILVRQTETRIRCPKLGLPTPTMQ